MPFETINDEAGMYQVRVGWSPEKWVQVGIQTEDGRPIIDHLTGDGTEPAQFKALWGTLDRVSVNHLIRTLRRARDSAFGRDE